MRDTIKTYKGFKIIIHKDVYGYWSARIEKRRYEGTRRQEYYSETIHPFVRNKPELLKEAKTFIDKLQIIDWKSSGLSKATYLPE